VGKSREAAYAQYQVDDLLRAKPVAFYIRGTVPAQVEIKGFVYGRNVSRFYKG
jgi:hypothetical protein